MASIDEFIGQFRKGPTVAWEVGNKQSLATLLSQFRYLARDGAFDDLLRLKDGGRAALGLLKGNFPETSSPDKQAEWDETQLRLVRRKKLGLKAGFRVRFLTGQESNKRGFVLYNEIARPGTAAYYALDQLEHGAAAHIIRLRQRKAFIFAGFSGASISPVITSGSEGTPNEMHIPARKGTRFLAQTFEALYRASTAMSRKAETAVVEGVKRSNVRNVRVDLDVPAPTPVRQSNKGAVNRLRMSVSTAREKVDKYAAIRAAMRRVQEKNNPPTG